MTAVPSVVSTMVDTSTLETGTSFVAISVPLLENANTGELDSVFRIEEVVVGTGTITEVVNSLALENANCGELKIGEVVVGAGTTTEVVNSLAKILVADMKELMAMLVDVLLVVKFFSGLEILTEAGEATKVKALAETEEIELTATLVDISLAFKFIVALEMEVVVVGTGTTIELVVSLAKTLMLIFNSPSELMIVVLGSTVWKDVSVTPTLVDFKLMDRVFSSLLQKHLDSKSVLKLAQISISRMVDTSSGMVAIVNRSWSDMT